MWKTWQYSLLLLFFFFFSPEIRPRCIMFVNQDHSSWFSQTLDPWEFCKSLKVLKNSNSSLHSTAQSTQSNQLWHADPVFSSMNRQYCVLKHDTMLMLLYYLDTFQINGTRIQCWFYFITDNAIDLKWFHNKMFKTHNTGYLAEAPDSSGHGSKALVDVADGPSCARALDFYYGWNRSPSVQSSTTSSVQSHGTIKASLLWSTLQKPFLTPSQCLLTCFLTG